MKNKALFLICALCLGAIFILKPFTPKKEKRTKYESYLQTINKKVPPGWKMNKTMTPKADHPDMAAFHDFLMTFDPATGTVPRERMIAAYNTTRKLAALKLGHSSIQWQSYPSDMGGRTRTIMYDPNDPSHKKVWAGSVTGGLWYNNNITDVNSSWIPVGDFWDNLSIRCLTYDPGNPQILYAGTGEVETAMQTYRESSGLGFGIVRSTDGGATWDQIPSTSQFAYVTDLVVRIENNISVIYAGVASGLYKGSQHQSLPSDGLFRSSDQGVTWQQVLPKIQGSTVPYCVSDIALGADNRIYVGTRPNLDGEGAATLLYSDNGINWTVNNQYETEIKNNSDYPYPGRVVLATSASDPQVVYALIASGFISPDNGFKYYYCFHILRSGDKGVTWVKKPLPTDLTSGSNFATIAWHALDIAVDPNHADNLYIGGLDVHKSFNGGNSWIRVSNWAKMYGGWNDPDYIHADQHIIVYKSGSSDEILFGTDGGVFITVDGSSSNPVFAQHNKDFSTLQFYSCAIHPQAGINRFYGGLQDNGSLYHVDGPLTYADMVTGGDGAYCFYDLQDPSLSITSIYYNQYFSFLNGSFQSGLSNWSSGTFVSPADLDYKQKALYCNAVDYLGNYQDQLLRITDLTGYGDGTFISLGTGTSVFFSALRYSPYSPAGKATLFVGSESGRLYKVTEAQSPLPVVTEIGSNDFPLASLSSIAIGRSEDTLMATFSNYGVTSVFRTFNGGQTWENAEGNLPDMPVRWALLHPRNNTQALLATETGVWECNNLLQSPVEWHPVNSGMANVRVDMLQMRSSDNTVLAGTHGRGLFTTTWDISTGVAEQKLPKVQVFPNPTNGPLTITADFPQKGQFQITVSNLQGRMVISERSSATAGKFEYHLNLGQLQKGVYLLNLDLDGNQVIHEKIILD